MHLSPFPLLSIMGVVLKRDHRAGSSAICIDASLSLKAPQLLAVHPLPAGGLVALFR